MGYLRHTKWTSASSSQGKLTVLLSFGCRKYESNPFMLNTRTQRLTALLVLAWLFPLLSIIGAEPHQDSLLEALRNAATDSARIRLNLELSRASQFTDLELALETSLNALHLSRKKGDLQSEMNALNQTGIVLFYTGVFDDAARYYGKLYDLAKENDDKGFMLKARANINAIKLMNPVYDSVLMEQLLEGLRLAESLVREQGNPNLEKTYLPSMLNNLAVMALLKRDYKRSEAFVLRGLAVAEKYEGTEIQIHQLKSIHIESLRESGRIEEAIQVVRQALEIGRRSGNTALEVTSINALGKTYLAKGDLSAAQDVLTRGFQMSREMGHAPLSAQAASHLAAVFEKKGSADSTLKYLQLQTELERETKLNEANLQIIRLEAAAQLQELEQKLLAERSAKTRNILILASILTVILLFSGWYYFSFHRKYRQANLEKMRLDLNASQLQLEKERLAAELDSKDKQLAGDIMSKIQKNEILQGVLHQLLEYIQKESPRQSKVLQKAVDGLRNTLED